MNLIQSALAKKDDQNQTQPKGQREKATDNTHISPIARFIFILLTIVAIWGAIILGNASASDTLVAAWLIVVMLIGFYLLFALKVAQQWEKAVVLRLGKFRSLRGPGLFWIVPIVDATPIWIDHRVMVTPLTRKRP